MNSLSKNTQSVQAMSSIVLLGQGDLLELSVALLFIGDETLLAALDLLMQNIAMPQALTNINGYISILDKKMSVDKDKLHFEENRQLNQLKKLLREERIHHKDLLKVWIQ
jgi:hypothetical protein